MSLLLLLQSGGGGGGGGGGGAEVSTNDELLALIEFGQVWEPGIPLDESTPFDEADLLQLLWGYPADVDFHPFDASNVYRRRSDDATVHRARGGNPETVFRRRGDDETNVRRRVAPIR